MDWSTQYTQSLHTVGDIEHSPFWQQAVLYTGSKIKASFLARILLCHRPPATSHYCSYLNCEDVLTETRLSSNPATEQQPVLIYLSLFALSLLDLHYLEMYPSANRE